MLKKFTLFVIMYYTTYKYVMFIITIILLRRVAVGLE